VSVDTWIEPCAGMAAVAMRLYGLDPIIPWMGGKRAYAPAIMAGLGLSVRTRPRRLVLADAGPAGAFWTALLGPDGGQVVAEIEALAAGIASEPEARAFWHASAKRPEVVSGEDAARWVLCAGLSFRAGDVTSGYIGTDRVCRVAEAIRGSRGALHRVRGTVYRDARAIPVSVTDRTVVYLDPPYRGTKGYQADLSREVVVDLARRWHAAGATVLVSEREPVVPGWRAVRIQSAGGTATRDAWEYLTLSPGTDWQAAEPLDLWPGMDRAPRGASFAGGVR
jgi:hypothetical protein